MNKSLHKLKLLCTAVVVMSLFSSPLFIPALSVDALTLEEQLAQIRKELAAIRDQKKAVNAAIDAQQAEQSVYQGKVGQLRGEMEELQLDIAELELQIKELEVGIKQIEGEIDAKEAELTAKQEELDLLDSSTYAMVNQGYKEYRTHRQNRVDLFNVTDPNTYFKDSQYRELIETEAALIMKEIQSLRSQLEYDKQDLEQKQIAVRRDAAIVEDQKSQLEKKQAKIKSKMNGYYSAIHVASANIANANNQLDYYTKEQAKKRARAELLKEQIFNSFTPTGNGQYVEQGKFIGNQGSTGWSTGPHLHFMVKKNGIERNPCQYLSSRVSSSEGSCGWGSGLAWPMGGTLYYTSRYYGGGNDSRCFRYGGAWSCSSHRAIDVASPTWNNPVYAAHSGWLYKGVDQYGALYIIICENKNSNAGFCTGYWHLSRY